MTFKKVALIIFLCFTNVFVFAQTTYNFDAGVPSNFSVTNSTLSSSTNHIKKGSALAWNVNNAAVLTASSLGITSAQTGNFTTSSAQFYVYNTAPNNDTLIFSFYSNGSSTPKRVGHMILNFAGWRDYHRSYRYDYSNGADAGSSGFTLDKMTITYKPVNSSSTATIYLDEFTMVGDANNRLPGPHMQADLNQFDAGYAFVEPLQYFLNTAPATLPTNPSAQEQTDAATVKANYSRNIPSVTATNVTAAETYVSNCGIYRNTDGSINGTRGLLALYNLDTLVQIGNYVGYLTEAAVNNNDAVAKSQLLLFTEYILDQGLAEGGRNSVVTSDYAHCRNLPIGFLEAVKSGLLTDTLSKGVIKMLKWSNGYNIIYNATGSQWVFTDFVYVKSNFLFELAGDTTVNLQVRDYYNISRFLSLFSNTQQGAEDGIKPDGVTFHHNFNNIPYLYAWGVYADRANSLSGTVFRITQQAFTNMSKAFKTVYLEQSPKAALLPNSLCGRHPFDPFVGPSLSQLQEMINVGGDIQHTTIDTSLAQFYNYIYQTNYYNVSTANYDSFYHYNYAQLGVKRRGNWMVAMRGLTNTLAGTEIYSNQNRYGRYQSYGALEVLYTGGMSSSANGWIANGAGWDWNVYPGTTTVQLPWSSLQPLNAMSRADEYQNNSFVGALSLGDKHGVFAMDFLEDATPNYTANNLKFKKSVFTFDSIFICLGSSISSTNNSYITSTNLFQAIDVASNFASIYVNNNSPISSSTYSNNLSTTSGSAWMINGQTTGYYIPQNGGNVTVLRGSQTTPDQADVTTSGTPTLSNTANYSKAYISHGTSPNNASYHYIVVPGTTPTAMQSLVTALDAGTVYKVLKQTDSVHAVFYQPDSITSYAFFKPNNNVNIGYVNSISKPALLGIKKRGDTLTVTINTPDLNVITDVSDSIDNWHSAVQNISLNLSGNWNVLSNTSGASLSSINNTLTAGFVLQHGFSASLTLVKTNANIWNGSVSTDWNTSVNWSKGTVPVSTDSVIVPLTANNPVVNASVNAVANNLQIQTGAILTVNNSGTLNVSNGITVTPNGYLVGSSANINAVASLQQNIIGQRGWRMLANPFVTATTLSTIATNNNIIISNTPYSGSGLTDSRVFDNSTNVWSNVTGTTWSANTPYALFYRGTNTEVVGASYTSGPSGQIYSVSGSLNGMSMSIAPSNTSNFMLVGNPYAAPVNSKALTGNISNTPYYVYRITQSGTQTGQRTTAGSWVPAASNSNTTNTIPVLGVIAYQPSNTSAFNITTSDINTGGTLLTGVFGVDVSQKQLELIVEKDGDFKDELFLRIGENTTAQGSDRLDLKKFWNDNVNMYTICSDSNRLAIDTRPAFNTEIPVGFNGLNGSYHFKVNSINLDSTKVYLKDYLLNTQTELKQDVYYDFDITDDIKTKGEHRFSFVFASKSIAMFTDNGVTAKLIVSPNPTKDFITIVLPKDVISASANTIVNVMNNEGRLLQTQQFGIGVSSFKVSLSNTSTGLLLIQVVNDKINATQKIIKQ